jgi:hypothetical protein
MRSIIPLLPLLSLAAVTPAAAQAIVVPVRCQGECPADGALRRQMALDSVSAWAELERGQAVTYVDHRFGNPTAGTVDGAFFFPLPADAVIHQVTVVDAAKPAHDGTALLLYNQWSRPDESRWILEGLLREQADAGLRAYAGMTMVHVPILAIPPHGIRHVQIGYTQPLRTEAGVTTYRYPLSTAAAAAPIGHLTLGMQVKSEYGFHELRSPTHSVELSLGMESVPCPPQMRCGSRGAPSERIKVVRLEDGNDVRARDFVVVYTLAGEADAVALPPWRP